MPMAIRFFILMSHYRSSLDFSEKALDAATTGLKKIQNFMVRIQKALDSAEETSDRSILPVKKFEDNFQTAMNEDFNTPQALAATFDTINEVNKILDDKKNQPSKSELQQFKDVLTKTLGGVLGLISLDQAEGDASGEDFDHVMDVLLDVRSDLRKEKKFQIADKIRDELNSIGITIKDTPEGASWEKE
jgi:cysteinyl-tRNA synthetase